MTKLIPLLMIFVLCGFKRYEDDIRESIKNKSCENHPWGYNGSDLVRCEMALVRAELIEIKELLKTQSRRK